MSRPEPATRISEGVVSAYDPPGYWRADGSGGLYDTKPVDTTVHFPYQAPHLDVPQFWRIHGREPGANVNWTVAHDWLSGFEGRLVRITVQDRTGLDDPKTNAQLMAERDEARAELLELKAAMTKPQGEAVDDQTKTEENVIPEASSAPPPVPADEADTIPPPPLAIAGAVDPDAVIAFLNSLLELDRAAVSALVAVRLPCNDALAQHPTVQVGTASAHSKAGEKKTRAEIYVVGLLGLLNGLCGTDAEGWGFIAAVFEEGDQIVRFMRTPQREKAVYRTFAKEGDAPK